MKSQHISRPARTGLWLCAAATAMAVAAGCSNSTAPGVPGTGGPQPSGQSSGPLITADAAKQLCDMMRPEVDRWRADGPTEARLKFNATVQDWALRNNGVNIAVMRNRSVIDQTTTATCPDVRDAAVRAIQFPDLASGLVGF
ncbi:hypothetical protein [Nocardia niigatensis]|uniref:hypothetical protein n=1 Tax=Nocardia niigatensis TaxID=209249 RepID=UPI0005924D0A|nr:hypothetical protein [Nocardia niigatensis]